MLRRLCRTSISPDSCVRQSEGFITRRGGAASIAAKFVPRVSVVAPPLALIAVAALAYVAWRTWRRRMFLRAVAMSRIDAAELKALFEGGHDLRRD